MKELILCFSDIQFSGAPCFLSSLFGAAGSHWMNRNEGLQKRTGAHLDLLQRSQLPGHHCLKCVLRVQSLDVCVCMCVSLMHLLCIYIYESLLSEEKQELDKKIFGRVVFPIILRRTWVKAATLEPEVA